MFGTGGSDFRMLGVFETSRFDRQSSAFSRSAGKRGYRVVIADHVRAGAERGRNALAGGGGALVRSPRFARAGSLFSDIAPSAEWAGWTAVETGVEP